MSNERNSHPYFHATEDTISANRIVTNSEGITIGQIQNMNNPSPHSVVEQRTFSQGNRRTLFPSDYAGYIQGAQAQTPDEHETLVYVVHATTSQGDIFASLNVHHRLQEEESESTRFQKLQDVRRALNTCLSQRVWEYKAYPSVPDGIVLSAVLTENIIMVSVLTETDYRRKFPQRSQFQPTTPPNLNI